MKAGKLNRRVLIQYKATTQDASYGTEVVTWTTLATVWAEVQDVLPSRSESRPQGIEIGRNVSRVRTRYRTDIDSTMRLTIDGDIYQIIGGPVIMGNREGLEMMAEKYSTAGA